MTEPESPAELRARHFAALCDLDAAGRAAGLAEIAARDPALALEVEKLLAFDAADSGPIELLRGEVAEVAGRRLLPPPSASVPGRSASAWAEAAWARCGRRNGSMAASPNAQR